MNTDDKEDIKDIKNSVESVKKNILTAIYVRVSTEEQAKEGFSLEHQEKELRDYCKFKKWNIFKLYSDAGKSGGSIEKRLAFKEMLNDAKKKKFNMVLVLKIDRFSRSARDLILTLDDLNKLEIKFCSLGENIDTSTAMGRAVMQIIAVIASLERELASERTTSVHLMKIKDGFFVNRPPFGYYLKKDKDGNVIDKKLYINPKEAKIVREIFEAKSNGMLNKNIAKKFSVAELKVWRILKNPVYIGKVVYKGQVYDGKHKAIIEEELFKKVFKKYVQA